LAEVEVEEMIKNLMSPSQWTRERPTLSGWYWTIFENEVICVYICERYHYREKGYKVVEQTNNECIMSTQDYEWWCGPIETPSLPEE